jgi:Reverse transcriptase (RNA-dependent DNA polymerase)
MDYFDTFALVIRYSTLCIMLAKAAIKDLEVDYIDINTAFLNPAIEEEIYMAPTEFLKRVFPKLKYKDIYLKLNKALYGLK